MFSKAMAMNKILVREIKRRTPPIRLNLGCGDKTLPSFINADMIFGDKILPFDARESFSPSVESTVDFIYCSHLLEHLESWDARDFLNRCWHLLDDDGIIRIVVPHLDRIIRRYLDGDFRFFHYPLVAGYSKDELDCLRPSGYLQYEDLFLGSFYSSEFYRKQGSQSHKYMYNFSLLKARLIQAGFSLVTEAQAGDSGIEEINQLESERDPGFIEYSLFIEAM